VFNLPPLPKVHNTRHLTCVTCKEKFIVTEGGEGKRQKLPSVNPSIRVRYDDNRQQMPVIPSPRLEHRPQSDSFQSRPLFNEEEVNCPRCGADNRNWLYLNHYPKETLLSPLDIWLKRMPGISIVIIMAIFLVVLMIIIGFFGILPAFHVEILIFVIPFALFGTFWDLTRKWKTYREDSLLYEHKLTNQNPSKNVQVRGIFLILFFSFFVPLFFVSALPRGFYFVTSLIHESPDITLNTNINNLSDLSNERLEESEKSLQEIKEEMQSLLTQAPAQTSPQFEQELDTFSKELNAVVTEANRALEQAMSDGLVNLEARREDEMLNIAKLIQESISNFRENFLAELRMLVTWSSFLGGATLITIMIAFSNLTTFIDKINTHLPLPIYHSVAGMTRLVTWEVKQALELEGNMQHIQWVKVERNSDGGINLVGLHRDPPSFNAEGEAFGELVRAQKYDIHTNMWGRIIRASITDIRAPRPAGGPHFMAVMPVRHDAPINIRPQKNE